MNLPRLFHYAGVLVMLTWAGVLLYFYSSGRVDSYLSERFRIAPLIGGLGILVVGVFNFFTGRVESGCCGESHDLPEPQTGDGLSLKPLAPAANSGVLVHGTPGCCAEHSHLHEKEEPEIGFHSHDDYTLGGIIATLFIVLVPVLTAATLAGDSFSPTALAYKGVHNNQVDTAQAAERFRKYADTSQEPDDSPDESSSYTLADLERQVRRSEEGNFMIPVPALYYSAGDEELLNVLQEQSVETVGQVVAESSENDPNGTRLRLYRLFVSCCLADSRPVGFSLEFGNTPPALEENAWVKVIGRMTYPKEDGQNVAIFEVDKLELTDKPADTMY